MRRGRVMLRNAADVVFITLVEFYHAVGTDEVGMPRAGLQALTVNCFGTTMSEALLL